MTEIENTEPDHVNSRPATRLANVPLFSWLVAAVRAGLCYNFEEFGHGPRNGDILLFQMQTGAALSR
jgi:hypothetical protein